MSSYYDRARKEILPHVPERAGRVLDIGCGAGATVALLRAERSVAWAGGVELDPDAGKRAEATLDRLWLGDLAGAPLEAEIAPGSLDLVLCLDVLEHLVDPWEAVGRLSPLLAPSGRLIVSVPNVRNWKFLWRLAVHGDFRYREAGLLDRTHLRFFTHETARDLATAGGLVPLHVGSATAYGPVDLRRWLIAATAGRMEKLIAKQILVVCEAGRVAGLAREAAA
ncbi:MAG: methyltransferase domain-containing protein [Pseudomonadota bacterium]